jgi:hypothetical protein
VITNDPGQDFAASGLVRLGSQATLHTEAMLNQPLGDDLALRFSSVTQRREGWNPAGGDTSAVLRWEHEDLDQRPRPVWAVTASTPVFPTERRRSPHPRRHPAGLEHAVAPVGPGAGRQQPVRQAVRELAQQPVASVVGSPYYAGLTEPRRIQIEVKAKLSWRVEERGAALRYSSALSSCASVAKRLKAPALNASASPAYVVDVEAVTGRISATPLWRLGSGRLGGVV